MLPPKNPRNRYTRKLFIDIGVHRKRDKIKSLK